MFSPGSVLFATSSSGLIAALSKNHKEDEDMVRVLTPDGRRRAVLFRDQRPRCIAFSGDTLLVLLDDGSLHALPQ